MKYWNDERIKKLRKWWAEGRSAGQIVILLNKEVSRSAVIGKVHRLCLARRGSTSTPQGRANSRRNARKYLSANKPAAERRLDAAPRAPIPPSVPFIDPPTNETPTRVLADLLPDECRWPIGDPKIAGFGYCGKTKVPGKPYCEVHAQRAYAPPMVKRKQTDSVTVAADGSKTMVEA